MPDVVDFAMLATMRRSYATIFWIRVLDLGLVDLFAFSAARRSVLYNNQCCRRRRRGRKGWRTCIQRQSYSSMRFSKADLGKKAILSYCMFLAFSVAQGYGIVKTHHQTSCRSNPALEVRSHKIEFSSRHKQSLLGAETLTTNAAFPFHTKAFLR